MANKDEFIQTLAARERYRDEYWRRRDPILWDRLLWRAQTMRHLVHLLPGESILEIGSGEGMFTRMLQRVSREQNPITCVTFNPEAQRPVDLPDYIEFIKTDSLPQALAGRQFQFIVAMDLLDRDNVAPLLQQAQDLLRPGGQVLFYESNPWNPMLRIKRALARLSGHADPRHLLSRPEMYELISEMGFIRVFAVYNDFVYAPLTRQLAWLLRNASILLENAKIARRFAGSILVHAQKPPRVVERPKVSLVEHAMLHQAISIVIPCHNEQMNIGPLINRMRELFDDYIYEIIPVDDNSKDDTRKVIEELAAGDPRIKPIFRKPPNGVGRAIMDGLHAATGKYVLSMDCDFQHLLPEMRDLFDAAAEGYDVAIGSRFNRHSVLLNYPFQKILANRGFHLLAQLILLRRFRDLTNNLKLVRREVVENMKLTMPGFSINAETGLQPLFMGYKIKEVPISWINRTPDMGTSSFRLVKVGGGYWRVLWNMWLRCAFGTGPYKELQRKGDERQTHRDPGVKPLTPAASDRGV